VRRPGSIGGRLRTGFGLFVILLAAAGAFVYAGFARQEGAITQLNDQVYVLRHLNSELDSYFADSQLAIANFELTGDHGFLSDYYSDGQFFQSDLSRLRVSAPSSMRDLINRQDRAGAAWFTIAQQIIDHPGGTSVGNSSNSPADSAAVAAASGADAKRTDRAWFTSEAFTAANSAMTGRINASISHIIGNSNRALGVGLAWSAGALAVAIVLALAIAVSTLRLTTGPLRSLTATVNRLKAGDHDARAEASGAAEIQQVAVAVNALADESDQLRRADAESNRLRAMARETGVRIREPLHADDVIRAARAALKENLDADIVTLHLMQDGKLGRPEGHEEEWLLPDAFLESFPASRFRMLDDLLKTQSSVVVQDVGGPEGDQIQPEIRDPLREAGIVSHLATPFGVGSEMLGVIAAERTHAGQPWTAAEVDAVESIASDLGRGLHHARLYEEENRLVEELKAVDRTKSDFVATVSHELRTPLTSITGYIEMLLGGDPGELNDEQEHMLGTVDRNASRLRSLIENLLTFSGMESGTFTTDTTPVNLVEVICAAGEDVLPVASRKGITVTTACADDQIVVNADAGQLARVMTNLLSNAVKFTPEGGQVEVRAEAAAGWAVVSVTDTGIGIPDADKKDMFTRFFRASNATKQAIPGTGLGLAITQTIIAGHGGDMELQSREGKGTTVTVRLPLAGPVPPVGPAHDEAAHHEAARHRAPAAPGTRS
jgi:two-component system phosphate regulon sensor histidine kinase PhoR